jgi:hypothetical protein
MLYNITLLLIPYLTALSLLGYFKRKQYDTAHSLIFFAIVFALISEILMKLCGWYFKNNIVIYNISSFVEFFIFFSFYYKFLGNSISLIVFGAVLGVFLFFYFLELSQKGLLAMFSYSFLYKNITLLVLATLTMRNITGNIRALLITNYSVFWINSGVLIYYSCTLLIFGLRRYTLNFQMLTLVATYLHLFFIFVFYGMLTIGLWKAHRN